ncbi:MAG: nuclear transport factor 2 family protein [Flavobacteriaceae bacterium]
MKTLFLVLIVSIGIQTATAQSEKELITKTLMNYMDGTANGQPERIKQAFHKDLNLYSIADGNLRALSGQKYIGYFKQGQKRDRVGKIVSIDFVNDAAMAKIEIDVPSRKQLFTDYLLLLKVKGTWKIIHKSYTSVKY